MRSYPQGREPLGRVDMEEGREEMLGKSRRVIVQRTDMGEAANVGVSGTHKGRTGVVEFPRGGWSGAGCVGLRVVSI